MTCREKTYTGERKEPGRGAASETSVMVMDNTTRQVDFLEHHVHHSPSGFSWGYEGSGPAELARCILWDHLHAEPAPAVYQHFKATVIGSLAEATWSISSAELAGWLLEYQNLHPDTALTVEAANRART